MSRSRTKVLENVKLTSFDDLFGGNKMEKTAEAGDVKEIPLSELHEFHNHPFQIRSDEELAEMIESVREHGVLVPGIVWKHKEGGYEIIAGHTRKHVCELLGFETMPVFVKEMDDDEASLVMVDSNIQRENIRPSEKAKAYKIKYDAMKNQVTEIDFQALVSTEKVHSTAAVVIENREKVLEGALQECLEEIEYKALPAALVDHVNVDVAGMKVGDVIRVKDLEISKNPDIDVHTDPEAIVVMVDAIRNSIPEDEATDEGTAEEA